MESPVGALKLVAEANAITGVYFQASKSVADYPASTDRQYPILIEAERQLREYFDGERREFDLRLNPRGTKFQKSVWSLLEEIPFGKTTSYGRLAAALGDPNKSRAVGLANGSNPISIIVPCHRVIGSDGSLTGFGGGLPNKQWLLVHEGAASQTTLAKEITQYSLPF
ncbi:MAG: methylated-DNA--[protein]-cysteine S-methyltransferase [Rhodothermales bacterium]|nr:methylated-DNA--[protein]-cysteine S-methyltransferase [Rhodothermales bacterium]